MGRKCSHCGSTGHNSRTCSSGHRAHLPPSAAAFTGNNGGLRLFGVQLDLSSSPSSSSPPPSPSPSPSPSSSSSSIAINMKKCFSLDSLSPSHVSNNDDNRIPTGYLSDGLGARSQDKRKGVPWTEEEHRAFLVGLERLGKGDWRGISRNYVTTRTPTQVASHAQKYFLRLACLDKKKRRSSLFDMMQVESNDATRDKELDHPPFLKRQNILPMVSLFGSIGKIQKLQFGKVKCEPPNVGAGPDLELSLAAPSGPLEGRKDSALAATGSLFIDPISVT